MIETRKLIFIATTSVLISAGIFVLAETLFVQGRVIVPVASNNPAVWLMVNLLSALVVTVLFLLRYLLRWHMLTMGFLFATLGIAAAYFRGGLFCYECIDLAPLGSISLWFVVILVLPFVLLAIASSGTKTVKIITAASIIAIIGSLLIHTERFLLLQSIDFYEVDRSIRERGYGGTPPTTTSATEWFSICSRVGNHSLGLVALGSDHADYCERLGNLMFRGGPGISY